MPGNEQSSTHISESVRDIIDILERYGGTALNERDYFAGLLQTAHDTGKHEKLGELAFLGKFIRKMLGGIRKEPPGSDRLPKMEEEFSRAIHDFRGKLLELCQSAPEDFRASAEHHYFALSDAALAHLIALASDFTRLKNWELEMRSDGEEKEQ